MNPLTAVERLGVIMQPESGEPTEAWGVLNPASARGRDGQLYLFARVVAEGNYSRIRMARVIFDAAGRPFDLERLSFVLEPSAEYERHGESNGGCEDPRVTFIPSIDRYVMAYTGFGPTGPRIALAISDDLFTWERLGIVDFGAQDDINFDNFDDKDAFFFPQPVLAPDGELSLACAHRPMTGIDQDGMVSAQLQDLPASIWVSYVPLKASVEDPRALLHLRQHQVVIKPEYQWETVKIGGGPPPVLTPHGWLLVHHGIENLSKPGEPRRLCYSAGAFIVDRSNLTQVVWRSTEPIMIPDTEQEMHGVVNNVVFPTGIDQIDSETYDLYYGMADARIGVARMWLKLEDAVEETIEAA